MGAKLSRLPEVLRNKMPTSRDQQNERAQGNGLHETGHDPAVHGAKLDDRNYNNEAFKKRSVDPSDPEQNSAALKIQTQFRQHSAKEEVAQMKEEVAATRIQAGIRGYLDREEVRKLKDGEEGETEEVDIDLNDPEVEQAAIKIQAGFKGFKARKEIQGSGEETQPQEAEQTTAPPPDADEEEVDIDLDDPDVGKAALKIQAGFRGLQARRDVASKKVPFSFLFPSPRLAVQTAY